MREFVAAGENVLQEFLLSSVWIEKQPIRSFPCHRIRTVRVETGDEDLIAADREAEGEGKEVIRRKL